MGSWEEVQRPGLCPQWPRAPDEPESIRSASRRSTTRGPALCPLELALCLGKQRSPSEAGAAPVAPPDRPRPVPPRLKQGRGLAGPSVGLWRVDRSFPEGKAPGRVQSRVGWAWMAAVGCSVVVGGRVDIEGVRRSLEQGPRGLPSHRCGRSLGAWASRGRGLPRARGQRGCLAQGENED